MPANNPTRVSLDVRDFASNGNGWTTVTASNGAPYSYQYTGGNQPDNNGAVTYGVGGGNAAITVNLVADARYQIHGAIGFANDPAQQLSTQGNAPRTRVVNDKCNAALSAQY